VCYVLFVKNVKADKIIEKFGLREPRLIRGKCGQKMDEDCIQRFVRGDPSLSCKYLEWMLYQAGGGKSKLDRSSKQWQDGEHGEPSLRQQLRECWIKARVEGYKDDIGVAVKPVTLVEATADWEANEDDLRRYHVYGDEEYIEQGCFGFYQSWPGANGHYETILNSVQRFHRHAAALRAKGNSTDLSLSEYPNLSDLLSALRDVAAAELKADVDCDSVYEDDWVRVYCPYNVGASLKHGIAKWCTANESMFLQALTGEGKNRWKEYAATSALYYCHFKRMQADKSTHLNHVAIQIDFGFTPSNAPVSTKEGSRSAVAYAKYWDADDQSHSLAEFLDLLSKSYLTHPNHMTAFRGAITAIAEHYRVIDKGRYVTNFSP
jgi:hypothetical protein